MGLDLPSGIGNIPNVLKGNQILMPTGYRSAESTQVENHIYSTLGNAWTALHTVSTGKTFYLSSILGKSGGKLDLSTGAAASEVYFLSLGITGTSASFDVTLTIPMKFSSGTIINGATFGTTGAVTLVGWEE